jgi:peptide chain release factor subunit 1
MDEGDLKGKNLKAIVEELDKMRGRHTELVTVYIPKGFNLAKVVEQLRNEQGTAQNIKSKTVRKNVTGALEKILQHLKLYKQTPENGLAIFCGNVSDKEGVSDLEIWPIEPKEPINIRLYRCDQVFVLDPLKEMIREREVYGLILFDKSEATLGFLRGKHIETLKHFDSLVPGKTKAGGWSQARYARVREGLLNDFMKKIGEVASNLFGEEKDLIGVIIGGPGPTKEDFENGEFLHHDIKSKVIGVVNTSYTGEYGLREIVSKAEDLIAGSSTTKEKKLLERFFGELHKDSGLAVYGFFETLESLKSGNVEILLVSEAFDWVRANFECSCGEVSEKAVNRKRLETQKCQKCGKDLQVTGEEDLMEKILKMGEDAGTSVEVISDGTGMGEQLKELGGIAGILRYKA